MFNFLHALEYFSKGSFIPELQVLLEVFEALLESIHAGPMFNLCLIPPGLCKLREVRMGEPEFLKAKRLVSGRLPHVQLKA